MIYTITATFWVLLAVFGMLAGVLQKRGKDYFPANLLLGLAIGAPAVFYLTMLAAFGFRLGEMLTWARTASASMYVYGAMTALTAWSFYLVIRANLASPGSAMDLAGHAGPPTDEQIEESFSVLQRADHHQALNALQRWKMRGWLRLMRDRGDAAAKGRREEGGWARRRVPGAAVVAISFALGGGAMWLLARIGG